MKTSNKVKNTIFEKTNYSVFCLTMCKSEIYNKWKTGNLKFCPDTGDFISANEADKINIQKFTDGEYAYNTIDDVPKYNLRYYYLTYEQYYNSIEYEIFENECFNVVSFGFYGYNY